MLSLSELSFERYFERVFEPVSFDLTAGSLLLVTGSNGCGKTTMLRVLAGLLEPSEGEIHSQEQPLYAGHNPAIKDDLSVEENIMFWMNFMGTRETVRDKELCKRVIKEIGLTPVAQQKDAHSPQANVNAARLHACFFAMKRCGYWMNLIPTSTVRVSSCWTALSRTTSNPAVPAL